LSVAPWDPCLTSDDLQVLKEQICLF
jgi:hypothetical protein